MRPSTVQTALFAILISLASAAGARFDPVRNGDVLELAGAAVTPLIGASIDALEAYHCSGASLPCRRVLLQVDERDAYYRWALDAGSAAVSDEPAGILDTNDLLLFRAVDVGPSREGELPPHHRRAVLRVDDPRDGRNGYLHVVERRAPSPPLPPLVGYDPDLDRAFGQRVALGFTEGIPQSLALLHDGRPTIELLDRIKIRASAALLWGLIRFRRSEADLSTEVTGWRTGALRVIRHQQQRVRLGWGIRSPRFSSYTLFYPTFAELPVSLRLNHPPAALFGDVRVEVALDFIDLDGWDLLLPGRPALRIGRDTLPTLPGSEDVTSDWFALRSDEEMLLQVLDTSPSLASTRRRLVLRHHDAANPPEAHSGERPAVGYLIDRWDEVEAGTHHLRALCFALPPDTDVPAFLAAREQPLQVRLVDP